MALIDALRMIAEPLKHLIDRVGRRVDCVERDIADVGDKVDFIHATAPIVQTASVGQTVVVKAVDENGKPTEWEAKDVSGGSAGGGLPGVIVNFTTDGDATRCDKTFAEVQAMVEQGRVVWFNVDRPEFPFVQVMQSTFDGMYSVLPVNTAVGNEYWMLFKRVSWYNDDGEEFLICKDVQLSADGCTFANEIELEIIH